MQVPDRLQNNSSPATSLGNMDERERVEEELQELSGEALRSRYEKAKAVLGKMGNQYQNTSIGEASELRQEECKDPEGPYLSSNYQFEHDDENYVYVKRSIQEFLNLQVLSLEKTIYRLRKELETNLDCLGRVTSQAKTERASHGISILSHVLGSGDKLLMAKAFYQLKSHCILKKSQEKAQNQLRQQAIEWNEYVEAQQKDHEQQCENILKRNRFSEEVAMLKAENRRLQLELEDRSRAAELLCKRLLRVDASARSSVKF